jgi:hypothetical protein
MSDELAAARDLLALRIHIDVLRDVDSFAYLDEQWWDLWREVPSWGDTDAEDLDALRADINAAASFHAGAGGPKP